MSLIPPAPESEANQFGGGMGSGPQESESPNTMSLMGIASGDEAISNADDVFGVQAVDESARIRNQGLMILGGVALVAVGAIFAMRMTQGSLTDAGSAEAAAKIEQVYIKLTSGQMSQDDPLRAENITDLLSDTDEAVAMFTRDYASQQVPVEYVQKNPFMLNLPKSATPAVDRTPENNKKREEQLRRLRDSARRLTINSIMAGTNPRVFINNDMYSVGDEIDAFVIDQIDRHNIILSTEVMGKRYRFRLGMQQPKSRR